MSLKVELTIEKTDLMFQEDTFFTVTITNEGAEPVQTMTPGNSWTLPALRVVSRATGWEHTFRRPRDLFLFEEESSLPPNQPLTSQYRFLRYVDFPRAGEYDVSLLWEWDGGDGRAFSAPVTVRIHDVQPSGLFTASSSGGPNLLHIAVWINTAGEKPKLCRSIISLGRKASVLETQDLGTVGPGIRPVLSVPHGGGSTDEQWVAWFVGNDLQFALTGSPDEPLTLNHLPLSSVPKHIVAPLNHFSGAQGTEGKFFLWQSNPEGTISRFQAVHVDPKGNAEAQANAMLKGTQPVWTRAAFLKNQTSRTYAASHQKGTLSLQAVIWPESGELEPAKSLGQWDGEFIGGGTMLDTEDTVHGAILVWETGPPESRRLLLYPWRHDAEGQFEATAEPIQIPREPGQRPIDAVVAVNVRGGPCALVLFQDEGWRYFEPEGGLKALPAAVAHTDGPLDLLFPNISPEPLILYAEPGKGFFFIKTTGEQAGPPPSG